MVVFFEWLQGSALSVGLRASSWAYPLVNLLHILGIAMLVGAILILDWRLLRQRKQPEVSVLATVLLPSARGGFALAVAAGLLLFIARPLDYLFNPLLQFKTRFLTGVDSIFEPKFHIPVHDRPERQHRGPEVRNDC